MNKSEYSKKYHADHREEICDRHRNNYVITKPVRQLFNVWKTMKYRCYDAKCKDYKFYGAVGIVMCDEWLVYDSFRKWALSSGYRSGLTINRKNNSEGYNPANCEWITKADNVRERNYRCSKTVASTIRRINGKFVGEDRFK